MAGLTQEQKVDFVYKAYKDVAAGTLGKASYEEGNPRDNDVHGATIPGQPIPRIPPAASTAIVKAFTAEADGFLTLTVDRSVGGNRTWVCLPAHNPNWSSGSADMTEVLKDFVATKYGKQYLVKVFDGNDDEIPQLSAVNWTFDYKAGQLVFNSANRTESGSTAQDSIKLRVYQYVGLSVSEMIAAAGGTSSPGSNATIHTANLIGTVDGSNTDFTLPSSVADVDFWEIRYSGVPLADSDFTLTSGTLDVDLHIAPESTQQPDIILHTVTQPE